MTLGTVQFGLDYGIVNRNGQVPRGEALEIIKCAINAGVEYIDTAAAYGKSEEVIGEALSQNGSDLVKIITKMQLLSSVNYRDKKECSIAVRKSFLSSCAKLGCHTIDTLMLHRAIYLEQQAVVDELKRIKTEGVINKIGVSVQSPSELKVALKKDFVSVIQMPFNILDYRWAPEIEKIKEAKERRNLIVHARSSLLQGLLCSKHSDDWGKAGIKNHKEILKWLDGKLKEYPSLSITDFCIAYVNSHSWIDSIVIGVNSKATLYSNLRSLSVPNFSDEALEDIRKTIPKVLENLLNPASWS
jgi:spore coat polysaccharide biosynthesis protein SpsF